MYGHMLNPKAKRQCRFILIKGDGTPACSTGGFLIIRNDSRESYVLIAQDCLNKLGYKTGELDGILGTKIINTVKSY